MDKSLPWNHLFFIWFNLILISGLSAHSSNAIYRDTIIVTDTIIRQAELPAVSDTLVDPTENVAPSDTLSPLGDRRDSLPPARAKKQSISIPGKITDTLELPRSAIPWYTENQLQNPFTLKPNYVDTTLLGFQMYDFATQDHYFYAQKGNVGHAHRSLRFSMDLEPGLKLNEYEIYGNYLLHHDELKYYRPKHVFTELFYVTGDGREQLFSGKHAQKFHETLHIGLQYRLVNSVGDLSRISARNTNFYLTADYLSPNNRYQALASVIVNQIRNAESGGLKNHEEYEENPDTETVLLANAESWVKELSVNLRHFYQTGFYLSADSTEQRKFLNLGRINHSFTYKRTAFVFDDSNKPYAFYNDSLLYADATFDSTTVHRIENQVSWSNFPLNRGRRIFPFNFRLFLTHSINTIYQPNAVDINPGRSTNYIYSEDSFSDLVQGFEIQSDQQRFLSFGGHANATLGGYHDKDVHSGAFLNLGKADRAYKLRLMLRYSSTEAPYFYNYMSVNNVSWENNFDKMQVVNFGTRLQLPFVTLEGNYFLLDKMVYLGSGAKPVQNSNALSLISLGAYSDIKTGILGLRNHILLQQSTTPDFERFPAIVSYHSLFFNFPLFDNSLINQIGFDFHYNTGYKAMAYMPVVRGFYIQDHYTQNQKYLLDVFWNGKVSNARLFVKYQNLLGLVLDTPVHYDIPFYPLPESMFKFGVSWMFFN